MEIMVIVFILIVILNLVGSLFKRVSEGQSRSAPAGRPRPPRYRYFEVEAPEPAREGSSVEGSSAEWQDKGASGRAASKEKRRTEPTSVAQSAATVETGRVAAGLHRLFTQKDQLVSAFIFHEVFGPPRRRR